MMGLLLAVMILLAVKSLSLDGAMKGVSFYLIPDFDELMKNGIFNAIYAAMGQAFFTLSIGMGGMAIFGSYIDRKHSWGGCTGYWRCRYVCGFYGRYDYLSRLHVLRGST